MLNSSFLTYEFMEKSCFHDCFFCCENIYEVDIWNMIQMGIKYVCLTMLLLPDFLLLPPRRELPCFCWPLLPPFWADREPLESMLWFLLSATGILFLATFFFFVKTNVCTYRISLLHQENPTTISFYKIWDEFT